ncbi:MAG: hypothetical protein GYA15_03270 [Leptolinea sp.]|nr:hypothetical protein [Leptolinea sp.]
MKKKIQAKSDKVQVARAKYTPENCKENQITGVFCLCDDKLKGMDNNKDSQWQMTESEVMTIAIVAALKLRGNYESARNLLQEED